MAGPTWTRTCESTPARLNDSRATAAWLSESSKLWSRPPFPIPRSDAHARVAAERANLHRALRAHRAHEELEQPPVELAHLDLRQAGCGRPHADLCEDGVLRLEHPLDVGGDRRVPLAVSLLHGCLQCQ